MSDDEGSGAKKTRRAVRKRKVVKGKGGAGGPDRSASQEGEGWEQPTTGQPSQGPWDGAAGNGVGSRPARRQVKMPRKMPRGDAEPPEVEEEEDLESREEQLKDDYLEFAKRYEDQMLYDQAIKYYRKAGAIQDIARVKDKMEDLYLDKAKDFEAKGRYYEAALLYKKMDNALEAERLTAMARDHGEFTMDDVGKFDLAGGGDDGPGGGDEGAVFVDMSSGEAVAPPPPIPGSDGDGNGGSTPDVPPPETPRREEGPDDDGILDMTGRQGVGSAGGDEGRRIVELKRGNIDPATVGGEVNRHLSFCPYCGEKIGLPKPPLFCPYCGDRV